MFCTNCGQHISPDGAAFCQSCGNSVSVTEKPNIPDNSFAPPVERFEEVPEKSVQNSNISLELNESSESQSVPEASPAGTAVAEPAPAIPEGFFYDGRTGLYYREDSEIIMNGIRGVKYTVYDPVTGQYSVAQGPASSGNGKPRKLSNGALAGIICGGIAALVLFIVIGIFFARSFGGRIAPSAPEQPNTSDSLSATPSPTTPEEEKGIVWADAGLEAAVRKYLNRPAGEIFKEDIEKIEHITYVGADITVGSQINMTDSAMDFFIKESTVPDLTDLSLFTGLKGLELINRQIEDLSVLETLPELKYLCLRHNYIEDISPLSNMQSLLILDASDNLISNLAPLSGLPELRTLKLADNIISDVSPLAALPSLMMTDLSNNIISDASPLASLQPGAMALLDGNPIEDYSMLGRYGYYAQSTEPTPNTQQGGSLFDEGTIEAFDQLFALKYEDLQAAGGYSSFVMDDGLICVTLDAMQGVRLYFIKDYEGMDENEKTLYYMEMDMIVVIGQESVTMDFIRKDFDGQLYEDYYYSDEIENMIYDCYYYDQGYYIYIIADSPDDTDVSAVAIFPGID